MKLSELTGNIKPFKEEFICAGSREAIVGLYRKLRELGANCNANSDNVLLSSKSPIVLFCKNNGVTSKFAEIQVLNKGWWDTWYNKRKTPHRTHKPLYKTYNLPKQWKTVLEELIITEKIPLYEDSSMD